MLDSTEEKYWATDFTDLIKKLTISVNTWTSLAECGEWLQKHDELLEWLAESVQFVADNIDGTDANAGKASPDIFGLLDELWRFWPKDHAMCQVASLCAKGQTAFQLSKAIKKQVEKGECLDADALARFQHALLNFVTACKKDLPAKTTTERLASIREQVVPKSKDLQELEKRVLASMSESAEKEVDEWVKDLRHMVFCGHGKTTWRSALPSTATLGEIRECAKI